MSSAFFFRTFTRHTRRIDVWWLWSFAESLNKLVFWNDFFWYSYCDIFLDVNYFFLYHLQALHVKRLSRCSSLFKSFLRQFSELSSFTRWSTWSSSVETGHPWEGTIFKRFEMSGWVWPIKRIRKMNQNSCFIVRNMDELFERHSEMLQFFSSSESHVKSCICD